MLNYYGLSVTQISLVLTICIISGFLGMFLFNYIRVKCQANKGILILIGVASVLLPISVMIPLQNKNVTFTIITLALFVCFLSAHIPVAFSLALEITYPI